MKLAKRAYVVTLVLLTLVFATFAQTPSPTPRASGTAPVTYDKGARSANDPRNTMPTVGTGGPVGGPTGLFTVYDGQTLRKGEFTFSAAWSNFDRDPGDADFTEIPVSFQIGVTNRIELFFNTDAYRGVKVNSPRNLSGFYLPNSRLNINGVFTSGPAIVMAPGTAGPFAGTAVFRPTGTAPFVQYPFIGGNAGNFGFPPFLSSGPIFGFPAGTNALLGANQGGNGADNFPGIGSVYGSILPGVVLQTRPLTNPGGVNEAPTVFTLAPSYLPDAPFINRTWGESAFNTMTGGVKWRFTGIDNPVGAGVIAYYKWYVDNADDFSGFNQLQRGASPGGNHGDIGVVGFADARVRKWMNISANIGFNFNSSVQADTGSGDKVTLLDRPNEILAAVGVDFPVNKWFQPIAEFRTLHYVGGRTPNAFENNPVEGLVGARVFPTRWFSIGGAYRHHFNQQDRDSFNDDDRFTTSVLVNCGSGNCTPVTFSQSFQGIPPGFRASNDPHGFIFQVAAGRRNKRQAEIVNQPANVTGLTLSDSTISLPCPEGFRSTSGGCNDSTSVSVTTTAVDPENDVLTYNYTVSNGRIVGTGANVSWDLAGLPPGSYTITAGVDDGCGICGKTMTQTVTIAECPDCVRICECPSVTITGPAGITQPGGTMTFTANVSGGTLQTPTYNWTVSEGEITAGQGTPSITVTAPTNEAGGNVTANLTLGGFDASCTQCQTAYSETAPYAGRPPVTLVDQFGKATPDEVKARVDNFYIQLNNNPNSQGYIIISGTPAQIRERRRRIEQTISFRKYDPSRVTIVEVPGAGPVDTKFYLVPPGATPPSQ